MGESTSPNSPGKYIILSRWDSCWRRIGFLLLVYINSEVMFLVGSTIQNTPLHQKKDKYFFPVMTHNIIFHFYCVNKSSSYFLCVRFRMATINKATLTIKLNSSYVLIIITAFRKVSEWVRARPPALRVSILYYQDETPVDAESVFYYLFILIQKLCF